jgi:hypothetical protein
VDLVIWGGREWEEGRKREYGRREKERILQVKNLMFMPCVTERRKEHLRNIGKISILGKLA